MKPLFACVFSALFLFGCATTSANDPQDPAAAIKAAEEVTKQADSMGFEWRDTGKVIKKAKEAAAAGDAAKAIKLANQAKLQSEAAIQQAKDQANPAPRF